MPYDNIISVALPHLVYNNKNTSYLRNYEPVKVNLKDVTGNIKLTKWMNWYLFFSPEWINLVYLSTVTFTLCLVIIYSCSNLRWCDDLVLICFFIMAFISSLICSLVDPGIYPRQINRSLTSSEDNYNENETSTVLNSDIQAVTNNTGLKYCKKLLTVSP